MSQTTKTMNKLTKYTEPEWKRENAIGKSLVTQKTKIWKLMSSRPDQLAYALNQLKLDS